MAGDDLSGWYHRWALSKELGFRHREDQKVQTMVHTPLYYAVAFYGDYYIALFVTLFDIPVRFSRLLQRIASIYDRFQPPGLNNLFEENQILCLWVSCPEYHFLAAGE